MYHAQHDRYRIMIETNYSHQADGTKPVIVINTLDVVALYYIWFSLKLCHPHGNTNKGERVAGKKTVSLSVARCRV